MTEQLKQALDRLDALADPFNGILAVPANSATALAIRADLSLIRRALTTSQPAQAGEVTDCMVNAALSAAGFFSTVESRKDMRNALMAALPNQPAAQATPACPVKLTIGEAKKWRIVPVEPTTGMLIAGNHCQPGDYSASLVWKEMLEAANRSTGELLGKPLLQDCQLNTQQATPFPLSAVADPSIAPGEAVAKRDGKEVGRLVNIDAQRATPEPSRPDIIECLTYHQLERDDLSLDECLDYLASGWKKVHGRTERQMVMQILALLAGQPATPEPVGEPFGWWFTEDPEVFSMPGSGFRRYPNKPQHTVECIPLFTRPAPGVPEGFALVPVEPTPEMRKAAADAWLDCGSKMLLNKAAAAVKAAIQVSKEPS